jgi:hypothetical protein
MTDTVTATAVAQNGATVQGSPNAAVTSGDAPASALFIKTLRSPNPKAGCATVWLLEQRAINVKRSASGPWPLKPRHYLSG